MFFNTSFSQVISPPEFHRFLFDDIPYVEPLPSPAAADISRRQVIERLMITVIVVVVSRQNKVDTFPPLIKRWFGA